MYRVITYRSKELKKKSYSLKELSAAVNPAVDFDDDIYEQDYDKVNKKNKGKNRPDEKTYIIDGMEVYEEDLTQDEKLDMEASSILNIDGFYNPLPPLDYYDQGGGEMKKKSNKLGVTLVVGGTVIALGVLAVIFFVFIL